MNPYYFRLRLCYHEYVLVMIIALPTSHCAVISGGGFRVSEVCRAYFFITYKIGYSRTLLLRHERLNDSSQTFVRVQSDELRADFTGLINKERSRVRV